MERLSEQVNIPDTNIHTESKSDYLENLENEIFSCNTFNELCEKFQINLQNIHLILNTNNIQPESLISNSQKSQFLLFVKDFYKKNFEVQMSRKEKHSYKNLKKTKQIASTTLSKKQKLLSNLENSFEFILIGLFEKLRFERIKTLKDEIQILKNASKRSKTTISKVKNPYARIIYTPVGGKVD